MTNIYSVLWGAITFLTMAVIVKVFVWDILDWVRLTLSGIFGETGIMVTGLLIMQYLISIILIFVFPIAIARGRGDEQ